MALHTSTRFLGRWFKRERGCLFCSNTRVRLIDKADADNTSVGRSLVSDRYLFYPPFLREEPQLGVKMTKLLAGEWWEALEIQSAKIITAATILWVPTRAVERFLPRCILSGQLFNSSLSRRRSRESIVKSDAFNGLSANREW